MVLQKTCMLGFITGRELRFRLTKMQYISYLFYYYDKTRDQRQIKGEIVCFGLFFQNCIPWWRSKVTTDRKSSQSRKMRDYILNWKQKVERTNQKWNEAIHSHRSPSSGILLPARLSLQFPQKVPITRDHIFKCMSLERQFSFKPPHFTHCHS